MGAATTTVAPGWLADPVECGRAAGFGVYLHIPFCAHRCGYCDFATFDDRAEWIPRYVRALRRDLARTVAAGPAAAAGRAAHDRRVRRASGAEPPAIRAAGDWPTVTSIFVGGGTPTLLDARDLTGLLATVRRDLDVAPGAEVTIECNPETASVPLFEALVAAGVTRVSMGAQSFAPHVLATLERTHTPERPAEAVAQARATGVAAVNLDLIYGTPGESAADWVETLAAVADVGTDHVSAYALTIHDSTPFGRAVARGAMPAPDPDVQRERFETARQVLGDAGFVHYEVSNWARDDDRRSRHNLLYWRHGDYLGVGVGAHAHLDGTRWWSHRSIPRYVTDVEAGRRPRAGVEHLSTAERAEERLLLGLRVREGLHPTDAPPIVLEALADAVDAGLVTTACGRLQATEAGWFLLDDAVLRLL